jgi:hypothetical protein
MGEKPPAHLGNLRATPALGLHTAYSFAPSLSRVIDNPGFLLVFNGFSTIFILTLTSQISRST